MIEILSSIFLGCLLGAGIILIISLSGIVVALAIKVIRILVGTK